MIIKSNDTEKIKSILSYFIPLKKYCIISGVLILLGVVLSLPVPYLNMMLVDNVILEKNYHLYKYIMILWFALLIIRPLLDSFKGYYLGLFDLNFDYNVKKDILSKLFYVPMHYFEKNQLGYLLSRIDNDIQALHTISAGRILDILSNIIMLVFGITMVFNISWKLALVSLVTVPLTLVNSFIFSPKVKDMNKKVSETWANLGGNLYETLLGIEMVKIFLLEAKRFAKYIKKYKESLEITIKKIIVDLIAGFFGKVVLGISPFLIWGFGVWFIINGELTLGQLTAFIGYTAFVIGPATQLASLKLNFQSAIGAWERIEEIIKLDDEKNQSRDKQIIQISKGDIFFKNVNFCYESSEKQVLKDITLHIEPGEKVAIVGGNGSGKSTLFKLLFKLYSGYEGEVLIDGYEISQYDTYSLRNQIALVSQNIFMFNETVLENIKVGNPNISQDHIWEIMEKTRLDQLISMLPDGLNTKVKERGANLSGGQKQLISIARALLKDDFKILIFDEATSSLDPLIEKYLSENIKEICQGKTFINIVHRPSFLSFVDRVIVLNKGEIVFQGSVEKLKQTYNFLDNIEVS